MSAQDFFRYPLYRVGGWVASWVGENSGDLGSLVLGEVFGFPLDGGGGGKEELGAGDSY